MAANVRVFSIAAYIVAPPSVPAQVRVFGISAFTTSVPTVNAYVRVFGLTAISSLPGDPPTAFAGPAIINVEPWTVVSLNGAGTANGGETIVRYTWTQVAGTPATMTGADTSSPGVELTGTRLAETATFSLIVTDSAGAISNSSTVDLTSLPAPELVVRSGVLVPYKPMRI